jgi:hypothetical protein
MHRRHSLHPCRSEGRFKFQALLDEAGLLCDDLEESKFTSIYARIQALRPQGTQEGSKATHPCMPSECISCCSFSSAPSLPMSVRLSPLVDWSGRAVRSDKRGAIDARVPPILLCLNIPLDVWQQALQFRATCSLELSASSIKCDSPRASWTHRAFKACYS